MVVFPERTSLLRDALRPGRARDWQRERVFFLFPFVLLRFSLRAPIRGNRAWCVTQREIEIERERE